MQAIFLSAHFDGEQIRLDEPFELAPNTKLIVTVVSSGSLDEERADWFRLAAQGLAAAYGDDEPEYTEADIKTPNPLYDGR
ncbi:hypothetical protein [uncultured Hymenobacter sp.]|uniref:hypothetical protein n=1 Tax=uncultured Hymenobacter sp. TaxID=170016 RepID=UPI0035C9FBF7